MDNITIALLITTSGVALSFALGYYGLARRQGRLTPRGRISLIGMIIGTTLAIGPEVFKWKDAQDNDVRARETLREIQRRNYSIENSYITVVLDAPWSDHNIVSYNKAISSLAGYVKRRIKDVPGSYSPPDWSALQAGVEGDLLAHLNDFRLSLTINDVPLGKRNNSSIQNTITIMKPPMPGRPIIDYLSHDGKLNMVTHMSLEKNDMVLFRNKSLPDLVNTDLIIAVTGRGGSNDTDLQNVTLPVAKRAYLRLEAGIVIEFHPTPGESSGRLVAHIPANFSELE